MLRRAKKYFASAEISDCLVQENTRVAGKLTLGKVSVRRFW
jgi:hypothetical protein